MRIVKNIHLPIYTGITACNVQTKEEFEIKHDLIHDSNLCTAYVSPELYDKIKGDMNEWFNTKEYSSGTLQIMDLLRKKQP